jgi:hypothetical protein
MSFGDVVEGLMRPLRPELYIGCRYIFGCCYGNESFTVAGVITNLESRQKKRWRFSVTSRGFAHSGVLALIRESEECWLLHVRSGENFTQLIEGNFELE